MAANRLAPDLAPDLVRALEGVAELGPPLDRFFVEVLVNDPDPALRSNRIGLLQSIGTAIFAIAKLTEMVVEKR